MRAGDAGRIEACPGEGGAQLVFVGVGRERPPAPGHRDDGGLQYLGRHADARLGLDGVGVADKQAAIDDLRAKQEVAAQELEEFVEEYSGEEGLLEDAKNDKGSVTKAGVRDRLKAIKGEPDSDDEHAALSRCLELMEAESEAGKAVKDAQAALDAKVLAKYPKLTEAEIKTLVVDDKWFASIQAAIEGEVQRLTQQLAGRVKELEERYAHPLPKLEHVVVELTTKVEHHLKEMGLVWA